MNLSPYVSYPFQLLLWLIIEKAGHEVGGDAWQIPSLHLIDLLLFC